MHQPTLYLLCGLPLSGKTTLAKKIADEKNALRFTPDEWMTRIVGNGFDEEKRHSVETLMWEIGQQCLTLGVNVILDFGFWTQNERDHFKAKAHQLGALVEVYYLDVPMDELLKRLAERNAHLPEHTFHITAEQLKQWATLFEVPIKQKGTQYFSHR